MTAAEHGQAVCARPITLGGARAPRTVEALAVIAPVRTVRQEAPRDPRRVHVEQEQAFRRPHLGDARALYGTQLSSLVAITAHASLVNPLIGWQGSGLATSHEEVVVDAEAR